MFTLLNILFKHFAPLWAPIVDSIRWAFAFVYDQLNKQAYRTRIAVLGWQQYMAAWLTANNTMASEQWYAMVRIRDRYIPNAIHVARDSAIAVSRRELLASRIAMVLLINGGLAALRAALNGAVHTLILAINPLRAFVTKWLPLLVALSGDVLARLLNPNRFAAWILGALAKFAFRWVINNKRTAVELLFAVIVSDGISLTRAFARAVDEVI